MSADDLMDILGKSVRANITGPFKIDGNATEFSQCLLSGTLDVSGVSGGCEDLQKAGLYTTERNELAKNTALRWDVSNCAKFTTDPDAAEFLQKRVINLRPDTSDRDVALNVCSITQIMHLFHAIRQFAANSRTALLSLCFMGCW